MTDDSSDTLKWLAEQFPDLPPEKLKEIQGWRAEWRIQEDGTPKRVSDYMPIFGTKVSKEKRSGDSLMATPTTTEEAWNKAMEIESLLRLK